ncbi:MAG: ATP-binding cassette domain-containing protein, partial [Desulfobulbaceae bacterium]|nr:ATP-binding cassette domain-containing protein [Desulfobulbaceae bacterium]
DPVTSLNPYQTLGESIVEPLRARGMKKREREKIVEKLATEVGLPHSLLHHFPRNASVGQNQRACIARALSVEPDYLFLDEPLSALDAVKQKEISLLLARLTSRHGLTCFLISHDLSLVKEIGTTVAVMYMGRIVEKGPVASFFVNPTHPYSKVLLSNTLKPGLWMDKRIVLEGEAPSPHNPPTGCAFHPRCPKAISVCERCPPSKTFVSKGHEVFCHLNRDI